MRYILFSLILLLSFSCIIADDNTAFIPRYKGVWDSPPQHTPNNKVPDGAIFGNGDIGVVLGGTPENQIFYFSKNDLWKAKNGYPDGGVCYVGQLHISSPSMKGASYSVEQRIGDAAIYGDFKKGNTQSYKMKSWCAAGENIVIVELEGGEDPVEFTIEFRPETAMGSTNREGTEGGISWYVREFNTPDLEWPSAVAVAMNISTGDNSKISLRKGEKATVLISLSSNHEKENYREDAIAKLASLNKTTLSSLHQEHLDWWTDFWQKSKVSLGDPMLEQYYYGSLYLLACCSRNNSFPPGLWGTSLTVDATFNGWAGDYHTNYNYMATWWGAYSSNRIDLTEPYDTPILEYMEKAREHAAGFLGKKGVYYPVGIGPKGFCSSMYPRSEEAMIKYYRTPEYNLEGGYMFLGQKSNALFCASNMFMRFYHTYDENYARKVYPFLLAVADFWEDYLVYENGRYVSYDDNFWEVGPWEGPHFKEGYGDFNPTTSLGLGRMHFKGMLAISEYLNIDKERRSKWEHILTHLSEIPTIEQNGAIRIKACEGGTGSGSRTAPGFGRVMMHSLLFPSGAYGTITDPDFTAILRDEIYRWDTDTIHLPGPRDARWDNLGNGFETYFTAAARVGYDGNRLLDELKKRIHKTAFPNLWVTQHGGGVETLSGVPSCINEMLLQGYEGVIRLFPVWPKEKEASFTNLRTHGAFLVSSSCKNGQVEQVTLVSEKGIPCKIENPWPGQTCVVIRENGDKQSYRDNYFEIQTSPGEKIRLIL